MKLRRFACLLVIIVLMCSCSRIGVPADTETVSADTVTQSAAASIPTTVTEVPETETAASSATTETAAPTETAPETSPETTTTTAPPTETTSRTTPKVIIQGTETEEPLTPPETEATTPPTTTFDPFPETAAELPPFLGQNDYNTLNYTTQKGFWVSYLEYFSILQGKTQAEFTEGINKVFDNISEFGFNTVYVQVRAHGDAYYKSSYYPTGRQFDGIIGYGPSVSDIPFDALAIMVKSAHDRGLSFHAWVNPMRLCTSAEMKTLSDDVPYKAWYDDSTLRKERLYEYGGYWYLTPSSPACVQLILDGVTEILSNYDVDGIHIDDYFYADGDLSLDSALYEVSSSSLSQANWRIENINALVRKMYNAVHTANANAVFGISPQGNLENNYKIAADVRTWCASPGYCDYILPQVYYGFENGVSPYPDLIALWSEMVKTPSVKLVIGLAPYKIGLTDTWAGEGKSEWTENFDILARQMALARTLPNYGGIALFRYESIFKPDSNVADAVSKEIENIKKQGV